MEVTIKTEGLDILVGHGFPQDIINEFIAECLNVYGDGSWCEDVPPDVYCSSGEDLMEHFYDETSAFLDYGLNNSRKLDPPSKDEDYEDRFMEMVEELNEAFHEVIDYFKLVHLHRDIFSFRENGLPSVEVIEWYNSPLQEVW